MTEVYVVMADPGQPSRKFLQDEPYDIKWR